MYGLGSRGGTPGGRFGGAFPEDKDIQRPLKMRQFGQRVNIKIYQLRTLKILLNHAM